MNSDQPNDPVEEVTTEEIETTEEAVEETTLPSGEDNNAQVEEAPEESEETQPEEEPEKVQTRWEQERERWIGQEQNMMAQFNQARVVAQPQQNVGNYAQPANLIAQSQVTRLEEELLWTKAFNDVPELKQDREFEDLVYENYLALKQSNPAVTPTDVANKMKRMITKQMSKVSKEAYTKAQNDIAQKVSGGRSSAPKRSDTPREADRAEDRKKSLDKFRQTGDESELYDLLNY